MLNPTSGRALPIVGGLALFLCLVVADTSAQGGGAAAPSPAEFFVLLIEDETGMMKAGVPVYFASNVNGWNPRDETYRLQEQPISSEKLEAVVAARHPGLHKANPQWFLHSPSQAAERAAGKEYWWVLLACNGFPPGLQTVEYKFTRGSWDTVEVDADLADIPNRTFDVGYFVTPSPEPPAPEPPFLRSETRFTESMPIRAWADQRIEEPAAERTSTVTGTLDTFQLESPQLNNTRTIRVWTPPGYADTPGRKYPVLYMHDGQNVFDEATSFIGVEWGADETAARLIEAGRIPPMIIVGIDNTGATRAHEYVPFGEEPDADKTGADLYLDFLIDTVMPAVESRYRVAKGPENTALGGSSYGGTITMHALMTRPGVFGSALMESPAFWVGEGEFVRRIEAHDAWPQRVFIAMGTEESTNSAKNQAWLDGMKQVRTAMVSSGMDASRMLVLVEDGAVHNESAWARRLPQAFEFLFGD